MPETVNLSQLVIDILQAVDTPEGCCRLQEVFNPPEVILILMRAPILGTVNVMMLVLPVLLKREALSKLDLTQPARRSWHSKPRKVLQWGVLAKPGCASAPLYWALIDIPGSCAPVKRGRWTSGRLRACSGGRTGNSIGLNCGCIRSRCCRGRSWNYSGRRLTGSIGISGSSSCRHLG